MLPAYLANPAAAIAAKAGKPGSPIDNGKYYKGKRIFGDGKTYKGFFSGICFGIFIAFIENFMNSTLLNNSMPQFTIAALISLPVGSMAGDLIASFFKRRFGLERGTAFPLLDQLDFVFGAWLITAIFATSWFMNNFTREIIFAAILLTPFLHLIVNIIGYRVGISREPW